MIYFDSSALVKLLHDEPESGDLRTWLAAQRTYTPVSSVIAEVEVERTARRHTPGGLHRLPTIMANLVCVELDALVRRIAATYETPALRSLDAIHLASAQVLMTAEAADPLTAFLTYDRRLLAAAQELEFPALAPGLT